MYSDGVFSKKAKRVLLCNNRMLRSGNPRVKVEDDARNDAVKRVLLAVAVGGGR
jgi:hypothetical protein